MRRGTVFGPDVRHVFFFVLSARCRGKGRIKRKIIFYFIILFFFSFVSLHQRQKRIIFKAELTAAELVKRYTRLRSLPGESPFDVRDFNYKSR